MWTETKCIKGLIDRKMGGELVFFERKKGASLDSSRTFPSPENNRIDNNKQWGFL